MKTTDQIVHQARKERADLSAYGSKILCFNLHVKMGLPTHTPPGGARSPAFAPPEKPRPGASRPPSPRGAGRGFPDQGKTSPTHSTPTPNEIMLK